MLWGFPKPSLMIRVLQGLAKELTQVSVNTDKQETVYLKTLDHVKTAAKHTEDVNETYSRRRRRIVSWKKKGCRCS